MLVYNQLSYIYEYVDDSSWFRHCATSREIAGSIPDGFIGFFFYFDPGVDSVSSRNEYQEFTGGGGAGAKG